MNDFQKNVKSIIEDYCEGINHLEFSVDNFDEMLERIEAVAKGMNDDCVVDSNYQVGQVVKIINDKSGHRFELGQRAILMEKFEASDLSGPTHWCAGDEKSLQYWYINEDEFESIKE